MSRRVRRLIDVSKKKQGFVSQRDMEGAAHRLSKPADKFSANRAVPSEKPEPYCVVYFRNNPDAVDIRPPADKLQDLYDKLDEDLEPSLKFTTLIQIKSAQYMLHGENSVEALRAHAQLGFFYNENLRPQSALRHLEKAHMLERTNTIEPEETIEIAVETAQAHISLKNESKKNTTTRHVMQAEETLRPYYDTEIEDLHLRYKRNLVKARIFSAKKKYDEALQLYEIALETLQEENDGEETPDEAKLFVEMAETAELQNLRRKAGGYYKRAYDIFQNLGMEESAKNIEDKLPNSDDEDEMEGEEEDIESGNHNYDDNEEEDDTEENLYSPHPPGEEGSRHSSRPSSTNQTAGDTDGENYPVKEPPARLDVAPMVDNLVGNTDENNEEEGETETADGGVSEQNNEDGNESGHQNEEEENNDTDAHDDNNNDEEEENNDTDAHNEEEDNKDE